MQGGGAALAFRVNTCLTKGVGVGGGGRGSWEGVKHAAGPRRRVRDGSSDLFHRRLRSFLSDSRLDTRCKRFQRRRRFSSSFRRVPHLKCK